MVECVGIVEEVEIFSLNVRKKIGNTIHCGSLAILNTEVSIRPVVNHNNIRQKCSTESSVTDHPIHGETTIKTPERISLQAANTRPVFHSPVKYDGTWLEFGAKDHSFWNRVYFDKYRSLDLIFVET